MAVIDVDHLLGSILFISRIYIMPAMTYLVITGGCQVSSTSTLPGKVDSPGTVGVLYGENPFVGTHGVWLARGSSGVKCRL